MQTILLEWTCVNGDRERAEDLITAFHECTLHQTNDMFAESIVYLHRIIEKQTMPSGMSKAESSMGINTKKNSNHMSQLTRRRN